MYVPNSVTSQDIIFVHHLYYLLVLFKLTYFYLNIYFLCFSPWSLTSIFTFSPENGSQHLIFHNLFSQTQRMLRSGKDFRDNWERPLTLQMRKQTWRGVTVYLPKSQSKILNALLTPHFSYLSYNTFPSFPLRRSHFPKFVLIISFCFSILDTYYSFLLFFPSWYYF